MRPMSKTEAYITLSIKEAANNGQNRFLFHVQAAFAKDRS